MPAAPHHADRAAALQSYAVAADGCPRFRSAVMTFPPTRTREAARRFEIAVSFFAFQQRDPAHARADLDRGRTGEH